MADPLNASDRFAVEWTDALIELNRFTNGIRRRVVSTLLLLQEDLVAEIARADLEGVPGDATRRRRLEGLLRDVQETIDKRYALGARRLVTELRSLASLTNEVTAHVFNKVFTVNIVRPTLTQDELKVLVDRNVVLGEPAIDWWDGQSEATRRRFVREMRMGVAAGETNEQLIQRVRGRATGRTLEIETGSGDLRRVREFANGIMDTSSREAETLVRTSAQSVSNAAILETYKQNDDLVKGWYAIVTLDNRTSAICMARAGASWSLDGEPMPDSPVQEQFPGPPPWHFRCRTVLGPLLKSWDDLYEDATGKRKTLLNTVPDSVRASMDGLVSGKIKTFDDWLKTKSDTFAESKLGPGLFKLWKEGKITLAQLINDTGKPRTLAQVRAAIGLGD